MRKITFILLLTIMAFAGKQSSAQDAGNKFRFGLFGQPSLAWYKPDNTDKMESKSLKLKFAYGLITDFSLTKVVSFSTGIQVNYSGGGLGILKDTVVYSFNDAKDTFNLKTRNYRISYATIPITLKMKTSDIGGFTWYGQFGGDISFKTKARSTADDGFTVKNKAYTPGTQKDVDISKDMNFINIGLNIGAGFEYNLAGTTSLLVGVNYHNGFTNALRASSKSLLLKTTEGYSSYKQNAKSNYVSMTLGVLF